MKFEKIQVGDIVYINNFVTFGVIKTNFWVPATVEKVTKTQFSAGGNRYLKGTGYRLGCFGSECAKSGKDKGIFDQRQAMKEYKEKVNICYEVTRLASDLRGVSPSNSNLVELHSFVDKIRELIKAGGD